MLSLLSRPTAVTVQSTNGQLPVNHMVTDTSSTVIVHSFVAGHCVTADEGMVMLDEVTVTVG